MGVVAVEVDVDLALEAVGILVLDLVRHALDDVRGLVHRVPGLADGLPDDALHALEELLGEAPGGALLAGEGAVGAQALQVGQELLHVAQVLQGLAVGLLLRYAVSKQLLEALVEVVAELLDELHLGGAVGGGGQALRHRDDESCANPFHITHPPKRSGRPEGPW